MKDFYRYSDEIFQFDSGVFPLRVRQQTDSIDSELRRTANLSLSNEYIRTESMLKNQNIAAGKGANVSPTRITNILKKLPPFASDLIDQDDIDRSNDKGRMGWTFML